MDVPSQRSKPSDNQKASQNSSKCRKHKSRKPDTSVRHSDHQLPSSGQSTPNNHRDVPNKILGGQKTNPSRQLPLAEPDPSAQPIQTETASRTAFIADPPLQTQIRTLPLEVQNLAFEYDLIFMSILSSAKIEQKVRNVLERVRGSNLMKPTMKPGVVILHARADTVSKMVAIIEIAKREVEKEQAQWYQYSKLESTIIEVNRKSKSQERAFSQNQILNDPGTHIHQNSVSTQIGSAGVEAANDAQDAEEAFQTMAIPPKEHTKRQMKIRQIPVLTIYLARVPVTALKELYGEQTNA